MRQIKTILFPTDFSDSAEAAKVHAVKLARAFKAEIVALHVRTIFHDDPQALARHLRSNGDHNKKLLREQSGIPLDFGAEPEVRLVVLRDISPADAILNFLDREGADLVVMGTHGRTGLKHFMLGSVAEEVVREAPCPVVTVGPNAGSSPCYKKILVGFDYSDHARAALREAADLARQLDSELDVLLVVQQSVHPSYQEYYMSATSRALPTIEAELEHTVAQVLGKLAPQDIKVTASLGSDRTAREIAEFARSAEADLIVLGTHGFSGLNRLLLGSTSEQVMRLASCPVLTVRPAPNRITQKHQEKHHSVNSEKTT